MFCGCAASGPDYEDVMANADPIGNDAVRIFLLRPRDADDGSNGGGASVEVNQTRVGTLRYGGFLYVDAEPGPTTLTVFGRYRALGACEINVSPGPRTTIYVDVGVRRSYMIAAAVGGTLGGLAGAAAVPDVYGSAGAAVATSTAAMATGDAAGTAASTTLEDRGERCRGPHKLELLSEADALLRLTGLNWSGE